MEVLSGQSFITTDFGRVDEEQMIPPARGALLLELYYQNGESVTADLRSFSHEKGVKDLLRPSFGEDHVLSRPLPSCLSSQVPKPQSMGLLFVGLPEITSLPRPSDIIRDVKR
ncbi:hypothetical protein TNCV_2360501 [Trichonephila clavipes]|nr:hypothetical protein TNCV_2360501 [Trichonephila clavipes]